MDTGNRIDKRGIIFVFSAPSGTGKTTLCRMVLDTFPEMRLSVSYTTRRPRANEQDGRDYHFVSEERFREMIEREEFIEWAEVHGHLYGTSKYELDRMLSKGFDLILDIDVQGARRIKNSGVEGVFIFLSPPSLEVCRQRLEKRGLDSKKEIERRLKNARDEISEAFWYDYIIINDSLEDAFEKLKSIIIAEKCRAFRMKGLLPM